MSNNFHSILITGGTGKLGSIFVDHFLKKGNTVVFTSRSHEKINQIQTHLPAYCNSGQLHGMVIDLKKECALEQLTDFLNARNTWPCTLLNNARDIENLTVDDKGMPSRPGWLAEFLLDVVVPYELAMAIAHHKNAKLENIVNIASMYGLVAANPCLYDDPLRESPIHYSVAKAALIHLTKELAVRLASRKIRVNAISYGGVEGRVTDEFKARYAKLCPAGNMLSENDVVGAVDFLVSEMSKGMTGHNLVIDGGWSVW